jgi:hypothetical protein
MAAIGQFNFGPITGNTMARSTAVLSAKGDRGFAVIFNAKGSGYYASVAGAVSANGKQIVARWAYNAGKGFMTGTLVLNLTGG